MKMRVDATIILNLFVYTYKEYKRMHPMRSSNHGFSEIVLFGKSHLFPVEK